MGHLALAMGRRNPKHEAIGSEERKPSTAAPLEVRIKKFCRHNKSLMVAAAVMLLAVIAMWFFGRSRAASKFASSQGLEFSSSADYKLPKKLSAFDTLSRGTKQYAFNVMKGEINQASVSAFDFSYTETKSMRAGKKIARSDKVHELSAMMFSKPGLGIKSVLVSPREFVLEDEFAAPAARDEPEEEDEDDKEKTVQPEQNDTKPEEAAQEAPA